MIIRERLQNALQVVMIYLFKINLNVHLNSTMTSHSYEL